MLQGGYKENGELGENILPLNHFDQYVYEGNETLKRHACLLINSEGFCPIYSSKTALKISLRNESSTQKNINPLCVSYIICLVGIHQTVFSAFPVFLYY